MDPSWSDSIHAAFSSCLPCFYHAELDGLDSNQPNPHDPTANRIRRARPDELEGLLGDFQDTDTEAEVLSLHSNPGDRRRTVGKKPRKSITFFGFNLFGRRPPPIHLPDDNDEVDELLGRRRRRPIAADARATHSSTSTFDSDAAPLDSAALDRLTPAQIESQALATAAEERRLKGERRQRRQERKEMKRMAMALAAGDADGEFEGFQGSGDGGGYPHIPPQMLYGAEAEEEGFGPFRGAPPPAPPPEDEDPADLDGSLYTRKTYSPGTSNAGSDSRSRTTTSMSQSPSQVPPDLQQPRPKKSKKKSKSDSNSNSTSKSTTSSPSLASPVSSSFPADVAKTNDDHAYDARFPSAGFGFPSAGFGSEPLPSPGLGLGGGFPRKNSDVGAALFASRGDD